MKCQPVKIAVMLLLIEQYLRTVLLGVLIAVGVRHGGARGDRDFVWQGINVTTVNVFSGEQAILPCFVEEKIEARSGKVIPDERRVIWEYSYDFANDGAKTFFVSKHDELSPAIIQQEEIDEDHRIFTEGGETSGTECVFPFVTYDNSTRTNTTHVTCEESGKDDKRCWCSVVPFLQSPLNWGFCPCAFPIPGVKLYAEYGTDPGMPCVFPFHYKGKVYHECTREHDDLNRCWCATTKYRDDEENNKFGFCPCVGPPNTGEWSGWGEWKDSECGKVTYRTRKCRKPKGVVAQVGVGRRLFCNGSSFEFKLFECIDNYETSEDIHIISLQARTSRKDTAKRDNSIVINPTKLEDAALFMCKITSEHLKMSPSKYLSPKETVAIYLLNVQDKFKVDFLLLKGDADVQQTPTIFQGYRVAYKWDPWSQCNRCGGLQGEKRRGGYCYTRDVRGRRDLPCHSMMLTVGQRHALKDLRNYIVYKICYEICPKVERRFTKVKPFKRPPSPIFAERELVKLHYGEGVVLDCDFNRTQFPAWQFETPSSDSTILIMAHNSDKADVRVDVMGRLELSNVQDDHAGYYSCFVERKLRRVYRIFVERNLNALRSLVEKSPPYFRIAIIAIIFAAIAIKVATTRIV